MDAVLGAITLLIGIIAGVFFVAIWNEIKDKK